MLVKVFTDKHLEAKMARGWSMKKMVEGKVMERREEGGGEQIRHERKWM